MGKAGSLLDFYLLTGQQQRMLLSKPSPVCFQSEVSRVAGICKEDLGL